MDAIEDVENVGLNLVFQGRLADPSRPLRGPCIIVKFCFQSTKFWLVSPNFFGFRQVLVSDRTDRRHKYVLDLPCFK